MYSDFKEMEEQLNALGKEKLALEKLYYRFYDRLYYAILENSDYLLSKPLGSLYNDNVIKINSIYYQLTELEDEHERVIERRKSLLIELSSKRKELREIIKGHPDIVELEKKIMIQNMDTEEYISYIDKSLEEFKIKLKQYRDPLFVYLLKLNFGTDNYKRNKLFSAIDYWIASKINYSDNLNNFNMLINVLNRGNELIAIANTELESYKKERDNYIRNLDESREVVELEEKLIYTDKVISKMVKDMIELNKAAEAEAKRIANFNTRLGYVMGKLFKEPIQNQLDYLRIEVDKSPSDKDDVVFRRLLVIGHKIDIKDKQIKDIEYKLKNLKIRLSK